MQKDKADPPMEQFKGINSVDLIRMDLTNCQQIPEDCLLWIGDLCMGKEGSVSGKEFQTFRDISREFYSIWSVEDKAPSSIQAAISVTSSFIDFIPILFSQKWLKPS